MSELKKSDTIIGGIVIALFLSGLLYYSFKAINSSGKENVPAEEEKKISSFTDSRDGKIYRAVEIGTQTWMAENLNYEVKGSICYDDDPAYCAKYGRLYDWATAMKLPVKCNLGYCTKQVGNPHRGICPEGWHLPSREEWQTLIDFTGRNLEKLKAKIGWNNYKGKSGNGTDNYGFAALPGGNGCEDFKQYCIPGDIGSWLGTTETICEGCDKDVRGKDAVGLTLLNHNKATLQLGIAKTILNSVRCVKD